MVGTQIIRLLQVVREFTIQPETLKKYLRSLQRQRVKPTAEQ